MATSTIKKQAKIFSINLGQYSSQEATQTWTFAEAVGCVLLGIATSNGQLQQHENTNFPVVTFNNTTGTLLITRSSAGLYAGQNGAAWFMRV